MITKKYTCRNYDMSLKRKRFSLLFFIIAFAFQLVGCTPAPKIDSDLLGDKNCIPPCWMEIRPGITDKNTAIQILENLNAKEGGKLTILTDSIQWKNKIKKYYSLSVEDNLISSIKIESDVATIGDLVKLFGQPDYLLKDTIRHGAYTVLLLYPDKGLIFRGGVDSSERKVLTSDINIITAIYSKPGKLIDLLKTVYGKNYDEIILKYVQKWPDDGEVP